MSRKEIISAIARTTKQIKDAEHEYDMIDFRIAYGNKFEVAGFIDCLKSELQGYRNALTTAS